MPSPDYSVTIQILTMLQRLEQSGRRAMPVHALAAELEVHPRTVKRWVEALSTALVNGDGKPLLMREHREGAAWIVLPRDSEPVSATVFQFACAWAAVRQLGGPTGSLLSDVAGELVDQAEGLLPPRLKPLVERVPTAFCTVPFAPTDYRAHEAVLDTVVGAVLRQRCLRLRYQNLAGKRSVQVVEPYTLVLYRENLYVLARVTWAEGDSLRTFAIHRISEAEVQRDRSFDLPDGYDPGAAFAQVLGLWRTEGPTQRVRLRFSEEVAPAIAERQWAGFAGLEPEESGETVLSLDLQDTPELRTWILSWGAEVEVLGPPFLRVAIAELLRRAASQYA